MNTDYLVIGGGIVGLGTAWRLQTMHPGSHVCLLEKELEVGNHQSGNNSGVLHCGLYYKPGSTKAILAVRGIRQMVEFCQEANIAHEVCGKLVVACDDAELGRLRKLEDRGRQNGLEGIEFLGREAMLEREPNVGGIAALRVPQEGIIDYPAVCRELRRRIEANGGDVQTGARVTRLEHRGGEWIAATTSKGDFTGRFLVNCAGLHCDRVAGLAGERLETRIVPFRGEYYKLTEAGEGLVRHLIYPVPDPQFPFLGVHFTRLIHGGIEAGPNAVLAFAREGYRKTDVNLRDLFDAVTYPGLWRFVAKHPRMTALELWQSFSKRRFCRALQKLVPNIRVSDIEPGGAGVRAQAMAREGELIQDFCLIERPEALHVLNAPSPAATASLAIGEEIVRQILETK
ncbi:MAG: L-2-hydroxyglutarate oxidase [Verrucomicrobiota bacterium]|jgi:L-2-hydroxyglutarate oxidase LhgO|nr:L-2-hydroxyglutarate oxidase [Verrucomicrobiota bacterium]MDP6251761.1 L-2-hydroxyglutarate oxidase [Verrucomicrobiota bacterium]MDP7177544.1 L-2-hydroxyglutarate oxidase [Verrucomicrobiota bacterium]MDP7291373.1 L-2-hydroxyglutarate oxidase [Verrucomicrobiota bacterium]MDP7441989.1 L-2-hydroxyglutarate oxidase [Verrucomicrobiota bacterium]|tara:strand:- start:785 stop:1984 length:1200 start_codon:yes stop_codon:yes gene_type:complete